MNTRLLAASAFAILSAAVSAPALAGSAAASSGASAVETVDAFAAALKAGDAVAVERLVAPDVLIAESGGAERSFPEYAGHHMPADMAFVKAVASTIKDRRVFAGDTQTTVVTEAISKGTFRDKPVHSRLMETMTLQKTGEEWRIVHIHWSSAKIEEHGEH